MLVDVEKPNIQLSYEQIAHLHTRDFERGVCQNDFVQKYSGRHNIIQFMFLFRQKYNVGAYDPTPEDKLDEFISRNTPFDNWKEFLTAAYEHQAAPDEIAALLNGTARGNGWAGEADPVHRLEPPAVEGGDLASATKIDVDIMLHL